MNRHTHDIHLMIYHVLLIQREHVSQEGPETLPVAIPPLPVFHRSGGRQTRRGRFAHLAGQKKQLSEGIQVDVLKR